MEATMATEDSLKRIEERLTRLESALTQQPGGPAGFTPPGGTVVDSPPWAGGGGGWVSRPPWWAGGWGPRPWPWPHPIVDPPNWPQPVVDPQPWPHPVVDRAPFPPFQNPMAAASFARIGQIGDPPPIDVSRFSLSQLEAALHSINAEKARLNSLETMIKQQIDRTQKG
jgi:hypothetical protein